MDEGGGNTFAIVGGDAECAAFCEFAARLAAAAAIQWIH